MKIRSRLHLLENLGWSDFFEDQLLKLELPDDVLVGRVIQEERTLFKVQFSDEHTALAELPGSVRAQKSARPGVGDWVICEPITGQDRVLIRDRLERKSALSRQAAGEKVEEQLLAANVDYVFIASSANSDWNERRIERYLTLAWNGGAVPVVLLTKADLCDNISERITEFEAVAAGVDIIAVCSLKDDLNVLLKKYLNPGVTIAILGSSGVGKSTLVNALKGQAVLKTQSTLDNEKGKHTTTGRTLVSLPSGACIIDTPGMRELQLWLDQDGLDLTFKDITDWMLECKFTNCEHETEPGCRIKKAMADGELTEERFNSYKKLLRELAAHARKHDKSAASAEKEKWKKLHKQQRAKYKARS